MRSLLAAGWAAFSIFFVSAAAWPSEPPLPEPGPISVPLSFQEIAKRALPSVEALGVESRLAESFQLLGAGRGHLREGPTVGIATGPRRGPSATTGDLAVEVELPLALASEPRNRLAAEVASATAALREGAAREARLRLRRAYLDAWLAERILSLRAAELSTVETWLAAARARLAAGADPPFEASLVEGEILGARLALDQAREERTLAWGALRALASLPEEPSPLADPDSEVPPGVSDASVLPERCGAGPLVRALDTGFALETAMARFRLSRELEPWSLRGGASREGDERFARLGLAYRFRLSGEPETLRRETEARLEAARRNLDLDRAALDARCRAALERSAGLAGAPPSPDFARALSAVGLRLQEGRERPSDALPIRRQLFEAQAAVLRREHAAQVVAAELSALTDAPSAPSLSGAQP